MICALAIIAVVVVVTAAAALPAALAVVVAHAAAAAAASACRQVRLFCCRSFFVRSLRFLSLSACAAGSISCPLLLFLLTAAASAGVVPAAKVIRSTFRIAALATK